MAYADLKKSLEEYDWGNGSEGPKEILADADCDLALALEIFYLTGGYEYLKGAAKKTKLQKWTKFVNDLYEDILNNKYPKTYEPFKIPLSSFQKFKLRIMGVPEIFLMDL